MNGIKHTKRLDLKLKKKDFILNELETNKNVNREILIFFFYAQ